MGSLFYCPPSIQVFFTHIFGRSLNFCWPKHCYFPTLAPCWGFFFSGQILIFSQPPYLLWHCCLLLSARYFHISNFHLFHIFLNQSLLFPNPPPVFGLVAPCLRRPHDRAAISPVVSTSTCVPHSHNTTHTTTHRHNNTHISVPIDTIPHSHNTTHTTTHRHNNTSAHTTQSQYHTHIP